MQTQSNGCLKRQNRKDFRINTYIALFGREKGEILTYCISNATPVESLSAHYIETDPRSKVST